MVANGLAGRAPGVKGMLALGIATATLLALLTLGAGGAGAAQGGAPAPAAETRPLDAYGKLPLAFVANAGQTDARVRYQAQATGAGFYFTRTKAVFALRHGKKGVALELSFLGANRSPLIEGLGEQPGKLNYLIGKDPANWHTGVRTYRQIVYGDVWPGIDVAFRGNANRLKYEFRLAPGADASQIRAEPAGFSLVTKASSEPLNVVSKAPALVGKSLAGVNPTTRALPWPSTAMPSACSAEVPPPLPPRNVE